MLISTEHGISTATDDALILSDVEFIMLKLLKCQHFNIYEQDKFCAQLS